VTLFFPSPEFDDAVAAVCHGSATDDAMLALNELLRSNPRARDEYLMRVEVHSRLASDPNLFAQAAKGELLASPPDFGLGGPQHRTWRAAKVSARRRRWGRALALAACLVLAAAVIWTLRSRWFGMRHGTTSRAVAILTRVADARWEGRAEAPRAGSALEPGWLRLQSGLAQVVFYSGARVVLEGPTELRLISPMEAVCPAGRLLAEVPEPARGFCLKTTQLDVVDRGTEFGINATGARTEVHVFKGQVEFFSKALAKQSLGEGRAAVVQESNPPRLMAASTAAFASMLELQKRSLAAEAIRYDQWRVASVRLNQDPSLVVHLDFENLSDAGWRLRNVAEDNRSVSDATTVGCQRAEGRWPEKQALEFQSVNDRVRVAVPGEFNSVTLAAWVKVKGLDRQFNSLFMCDGFEPGAIHWLIRKDGVLSLTIKGPGTHNAQIMASPPVLTIDKFGMWMHLAVVLDGTNRQLTHYVNGQAVAHYPVRLGPPYRLGSSELGNWNVRSGPDPAPVLIRNLSGSLDEFELFSRALRAAEIRKLFMDGRPGTDADPNANL
jgi:hypothetical protein